MISGKELFAKISNTPASDGSEIVGYLVKNSQMNILENLLTTPAAASVPDGWKLVPIEPTKNMIAKIHPISQGTCHHCFATVNNDCEENVRLSWQDMVAAAPSPGGQ